VHLQVWLERCLKANSHTIPCRSHAVPLRVLIVTHLIYTLRPCLIHTCHDHVVLKATSQGHSTARHGHGMSELASAIHRRYMGVLPAFGFFRLLRRVPRRLLSEAYQSVNCRTISSDISGYHADFHEGHGTVWELQGNGMGAAWHVWISLKGLRKIGKEKCML
jgi:hypothetical protein